MGPAARPHAAHHRTEWPALAGPGPCTVYTRPVGEPDRLRLAREQLARVQTAWLDPVDWSDLSMYAFYALENAVIAAADSFAIPWEKTHPSKVEVATELHASKGLPDVSSLLEELNALRKSEAYGETPPAHGWGAEDLVIAVEEYVQAVARLLGED